MNKTPFDPAWYAQKPERAESRIQDLMVERETRRERVAEYDRERQAHCTSAYRATLRAERTEAALRRTAALATMMVWALSRGAMSAALFIERVKEMIPDYEPTRIWVDATLSERQHD